MEAVVLLANSAEQTPNGLVHALGLGWSVTSSPTPPMAVVILTKVPWSETNTKHEMKLSLVDSDGRGVMLGQDSQTGQPVPLQVTATLEVGRPPGLPAGTAIDQALVLGVGEGLPLQPGQTYQWRLGIDGQEQASASFFVRP